MPQQPNGADARALAIASAFFITVAHCARPLRRYRKAALGGDVFGMFLYSRMCDAGRGTAKDEKTALVW